MTLSHRISILIISLLAAAAATFGAAWLGYQSAQADGSGSALLAPALSADEPAALVFADSVDGKPILLAQADTGSAAPALMDAGSASAPVPAATTAPSSPPAPPQASDVAVVTKLYKGGSFFGLGIMALYLGLFVWFKVDKKRAFWSATALGGLALVVESIRRGDTPNAVSVASMLMPTISIMIVGPSHVKAAPVAPPNS